MTGRVVVGVDGSPAAAAALVWAIGEAKLRAAELVACTVSERRGSGDHVGPAETLAPQLLHESSTGGYPSTVCECRGEAASLRVAAEEARLRRAALDIVHVVHWDNIATELTAPRVDQLVEWGDQLVDAEVAVTGVTGHPGHPDDVLVQNTHVGDHGQPDWKPGGQAPTAAPTRAT